MEGCRFRNGRVDLNDEEMDVGENERDVMRDMSVR